MATLEGRSLARFTRVYIDGYDVSGYGRSIGPLGIEYATADLTAQMSDTIKGYLLGQPSITVGTFNGVMQSTTDVATEISAIQGAGVSRDVLVAIGAHEAPAMSSVAFAAKCTHNGFHIVDDGGAITITAEFADADASDINTHGIAWGKLAHANGAETAVNTAVGVDTGFTTTLGGVMAYQIIAGDWAGTVKVQHADTNTNGSFADITGATVTVANSDPAAGMISIPTTVTVNRYVRWQLTTTGGTTITFFWPGYRTRYLAQFRFRRIYNGSTDR